MLTFIKHPKPVSASFFGIIALLGFSTATIAGINLKPVTAKQQATPTYRALIIGNNHYQDPERVWQPLSTALNDAKTVAQTLRQRYGFEDIQLMENASRRDILLAFNELNKRTRENDNVLVYYAGHGYLDTDTNKAYWVPVDAKGNDHTTYLRNSTIRDELTGIATKARHTLLISDSCFSGSLLRTGVRGSKPAPGDHRYYQKVGSKKSVQILAAGGMEYVDDNYRDSGHSPFTYFLLNELNGHSGPVLTASELSSSVEKAVANNVEQVPASGVLQGAGDEMGEFIFLRIDVQVDGVPADKVKVKVNVIPKQQSDNSGEERAPDKEPPAKPEEKPQLFIPLPSL